MRVAIINLQTTKRDRAVTRALEQGFRAHGNELWIFSSVTPVEAEDFEELIGWAQLVCLIGHKDMQPVWWAFYHAGKDILLVEPAYLCQHKYWRLALNGWQSPWMSSTAYEPDRLYNIMDEASISLHEYNTASRRSVTYAGVSHPFAIWHKLGSAVDYDSVALRRTANQLPDSILKLLAQVTYPHTTGLWVGNKVELVKLLQPEAVLEICLQRSVSLVSYAQPACVTAMIMGVPVVDLSPPGVNPLFPFVEPNIENTANPTTPTSEQRILALSRLACHQFTLPEIASGVALAEILPHTVQRFETLDGLSDAEHVVEQYKHMHINPKMFRGGLSATFVKRISALVGKYNAGTLLDYGSGKGRQYEEMGQHKQWGGLKPTCYDPAYPPYAKRPEGYFDGVICTDVAEHVPPNSIEAFLLDVLTYARRFVFFCIFTDEAVKYLPDGRNVHLTVKPAAWWNIQIMRALSAINSQSHPCIECESEDTYIIRNNGLEIVVLYRNKNTEKEVSK